MGEDGHCWDSHVSGEDGGSRVSHEEERHGRLPRPVGGRMGKKKKKGGVKLVIEG